MKNKFSKNLKFKKFFVIKILVNILSEILRALIELIIGNLFL